ncbi:MAG: hypothetical protein K8S23_01050 [Candidatus Cloacimonetes bacterium]|nr:hypothetical protein [Candidatus Cloacimonadota bacterium]
MKSKIRILFGIIIISLSVSCSTTRVVYVRKSPPARIVEIRPQRIHNNAFWIEGHWRWNNRAHKYVWVKGHWEINKKNRIWTKGHWKKTRRGWIWKNGYWK